MTKILRPLFQEKYGTERGYIRHLLALFDYYLGRIENYKKIDHGKVKRVVFVCLGNICRSAYAHHLAITSGLNVPIASLGLSTSTGAPANELAQEIASERGIDLSQHYATDLSDFTIQKGDLFLVMEVRQARQLGEKLKDFSDVQVGLLGNYCSPVHTHIHDPHTLSPEYFRHCFGLVENAMASLKKLLSSSVV